MIVKTDASNYAIAAIFSIILPNSEFHPVAFHYHTLTTSELNYDTHDKDLLPIFKAFQKWQHYLEGCMSPVDILTDHKNLKWFSTTKLFLFYFIFSDQVYCATGTVPKLHIKATRR